MGNHLNLSAIATYAYVAGLAGLPMQDLSPQVLNWQHEAPGQSASVKQFCIISSIVQSLSGIFSTGGHVPAVTPSEIRYVVNYSEVYS